MLNASPWDGSSMQSEANWWLYGIILSLHISGLAVNAVLWATLWRLRRDRGEAGFQLILGVAAGDTLSCLMGVGMSAARVGMGYPAAFESAWVCRVFGMVGYLIYNMAGLLVSLLALERYLLVCHGHRVNMRVVWAVVGVVGMLYSVPLVYERNDFTSDLSQNYCFPKESSVLVYVIDGFTNVPLVFLSFSYLAIFLYCLRHKGNVYSRTVCRGALLVFGVYLLCYLPKFLLTFVSLVWGPGTVPYTLMLVPPVGLGMVMTINPLLVLCLYSRFRDQALALLHIA